MHSLPPAIAYVTRPVLAEAVTLERSISPVAICINHLAAPSWREGNLYTLWKETVVDTGTGKFFINPGVTDFPFTFPSSHTSSSEFHYRLSCVAAVSASGSRFYDDVYSERSRLLRAATTVEAMATVAAASLLLTDETEAIFAAYFPTPSSGAF